VGWPHRKNGLLSHTQKELEECLGGKRSVGKPRVRWEGALLRYDVDCSTLGRHQHARQTVRGSRLGRLWTGKGPKRYRRSWRRRRKRRRGRNYKRHYRKLRNT
jgi:hypothetical protein